MQKVLGISIFIMKNKVYELKNPKLASQFLFTDDFDKFLDEQGGKALFVFYDSSNPKTKRSIRPIWWMVYDAKRIQEAIEKEKGIHMDIYKVELKDLSYEEKVKFTNVFDNYPKGDIDLPGILGYYKRCFFVRIRAQPSYESEVKNNIKISLEGFDICNNR